MNSFFYPQTLPQKTRQLWDLLARDDSEWLKRFYLSGGTALSLQLGHRESEDLDFFSIQDFDPVSIQSKLETLGRLKEVEVSTNTLNAILDDVHLQFLGYPYKLVEPVVVYGAVAISSILDIACTKLQTVGMRGSKKDFVDLYVLLDQYSLEDMIEAMKKKYPKTGYNLAHIFKSLVYFDDAEGQVMPRLHMDIEWELVKERMSKVVRELALKY